MGLSTKRPNFTLRQQPRAWSFAAAVGISPQHQGHVHRSHRPHPAAPQTPWNVPRQREPVPWSEPQYAGPPSRYQSAVNHDHSPRKPPLQAANDTGQKSKRHGGVLQVLNKAGVNYRTMDKGRRALFNNRDSKMLRQLRQSNDRHATDGHPGDSTVLEINPYIKIQFISPISYSNLATVFSINSAGSFFPSPTQ